MSLFSLLPIALIEVLNSILSCFRRKHHPHTNHPSITGKSGPEIPTTICNRRQKDRQNGEWARKRKRMKERTHSQIIRCNDEYVKLTCWSDILCFVIWHMTWKGLDYRQRNKAFSLCELRNMSLLLLTQTFDDAILWLQVFSIPQIFSLSRVSWLWYNFRLYFCHFDPTTNFHRCWNCVDGCGICQWAYSVLINFSNCYTALSWHLTCQNLATFISAPSYIIVLLC